MRRPPLPVIPSPQRPPALVRQDPDGYVAVCLTCGRRLPGAHRLRSIALVALRAHAPRHAARRWAA